ncbi:DNase1 protein [Echria macrotheca]|uniref:DNase1 protein n=1 Tax=Echria macrotheca TaxID=438768 RepID=A0AAJ0FEX7_9PEZI|nr:DNase1 protein [Echria macrotheca]
MKFSKTLALLASAVLASADNTITFISQDALGRTIYFTGNPGSAPVAPVHVAGGENKTVPIPPHWVGNYYAVTDGQPNIPGMLGEFAFDAWGGNNFFDVSAIVNPNDHNGVKKIWPVGEPEPFSGCELFPCNFAYYLPDDLQTKSSKKSDFYCTLGTKGALSVEERSLMDVPDHSPSYGREYVEGRKL